MDSTRYRKTYSVTRTQPREVETGGGDGPPTGPAGGVLTGNYPDPGLAEGIQIVEAQFQAYTEAKSSPAIVGNVLTIDCSVANIVDVAHTSNITSISITNAPVAGQSFSLTLIFTQGISGGSTITWSGVTIKWPAGTAPTFVTTGGAINVVSLMTEDGGSTWLGFGSNVTSPFGVRPSRSAAQLWYQCKASPIPNDGAGGSQDLTLAGGSPALLKAGVSIYRTGDTYDNAILLAASTSWARASGAQIALTGTSCYAACWFKALNALGATNPFLFGFTTSLPQIHFGMRLVNDAGGNFSLQGLIAAGVTTPVSPVAVGVGVWHLGVVTYDGSVLRVYLDGILAGSASYVSTINFAVSGGFWNLGNVDGNFVPSACALVSEAWADNGVPAEATIAGWYRASLLVG